VGSGWSAFAADVGARSPPNVGLLFYTAQFTMRPRKLLVPYLLLAAMAAAQTVNPTLYSGMRWRMIGPFRGGRALTVSGVPGQRDTFYFGAVGGGVWKTTNAGRTWTPIFDSQAIASIGALAVAPSDPNVIYAGSGEADMRSDISFGNGVYKSTDAGQTWQHLGLDDTRQIGRILVDPRDRNTVLVAALGHAYGPNAERGVFRSTDGGRTWSEVLYKDENTGAIDLAFDAQDARIVYATLWNARRPPWSTYPPLQGVGSGLYKSTDGGATWTQLRGNGLPTSDWGRAGLAASRGTVYVLLDTLNGKEGGLYRSDDRGATWRHVGADRRIYSRQWYFGQITADPQNPDIVYVPNVALYRSLDGGKTFTAIKGAPGGDDYHDLWVDPHDPRRMATASDQGTVISVDGGRSWSSWYNQPTAQMYHVTTDDQFPYYVYGAQQDSGTVAITSRSDYGSITYRDWYPVGGGESGYIAPDPSDPNIVYGGGTYGGLSRFDKRTGQSQDIAPNAVSQWGTEINQRKLRFTWTSPIVFSPQDPHTLYMGAQYVLKTSDRGDSWQQISPDLTGCDVARPPSPANEPLSISNAVARCYGVVYTIAPSPLDANLIWAGADTGRIWLTRDGGKNWQNVTPPSLGDWSKVSMLEASRFDAGTAYAAVDRHRLDDYAPHIYRTHDSGKTWEKSPSGRVGAYIHAIREDPVRKGLLYAATELGVYVSFDDGGHWQPLQNKMPVAPVHDLVVHGDDLVIATHGRSFWILDDVTPLRQMTPEIANSDLHLFQPQIARRVRSDLGHDTPLPPETPMGQNPPAGAIIDYYLSPGAAAESISPGGGLKSAATQELTLEILDSAGNIVRRYSSLDQAPKHEPAAIAEGWFVPPPKLETGAGEHRFVWDLRYASPPSLSRYYGLGAVYGVPMAAAPRGPLALPGQYQVRLAVNGKSSTQPLTLKMDPRVKATAADLQKQFDLEMQIVAAMRQAWDALQKRRAANAGAAPPPAGQRDPLAGTLSGLGTLLSVVDSADAAPTDQAQQAFKELRARLDQQLHRSTSLQGRAVHHMPCVAADFNPPDGGINSAATHACHTK